MFRTLANTCCTIVQMPRWAKVYDSEGEAMLFVAMATLNVEKFISTVARTEYSGDRCWIDRIDPFLHEEGRV
jgi:hypothetical protein